jgi:hypothetical protein
MATDNDRPERKTNLLENFLGANTQHSAYSETTSSLLQYALTTIIIPSALISTLSFLECKLCIYIYWLETAFFVNSGNCLISHFISHSILIFCVFVLYCLNKTKARERIIKYVQVLFCMFLLLSALIEIRGIV